MTKPEHRPNTRQRRFAFLREVCEQGLKGPRCKGRTSTCHSLHSATGAGRAFHSCVHAIACRTSADWLAHGGSR